MATTVLDRLIVQIEASTELLRKELERGTAEVNRFANNTGSSLGKFDAQLAKAARGARQMFALFGAGFGARALGNWIRDAIDVNKLTDQQIEKLRGMQAQIKQVENSTDDLAQAFIVHVAPAIELALDKINALAVALRSAIAPTQSDRLRTLQDQINAKARALFALEGADGTTTRTNPGMAPGRGSTEQAAANLRRELAALREEYDRLRNAAPELTQEQKRLREEMAKLQEIVVNTKRDPALKQFDFDAAIRAVKNSELQEIVVGRKRGPYDPLPEGVQSIDPVISQWEKVNEQVKQHIENTEEARRRQKSLTIAMAATFESRFIQAVLDGDLSDAFKGLIRDLAEMAIRIAIIEPIARKLADALSKIGKGPDGGGAGSLVGGLLGSAFGLSAPSRMVAASAGSLGFGGGGASVNVYQTIEAGLPAQYEAQLGYASRAAASAAYEAVTKSLGGRR